MSKKYSKDLSNVQPGDIRLVQFKVGPAGYFPEVGFYNSPMETVYVMKK